MIHRKPLCTFTDTNISRLLTGVIPSQNTRQKYTFDCALRGPFNDLCFIRLSAVPDSLWRHNHFYLRFNGFIKFTYELYHRSPVLSSNFFNHAKNAYKNAVHYKVHGVSYDNCLFAILIAFTIGIISIPQKKLLIPWIISNGSPAAIQSKVFSKSIPNIIACAGAYKTPKRNP